LRKLIVWNMVSLDCYYEGPGGDVMVLPLDGSFDIYSAERMREADTLLLGHKTYDAFRSFWSSMADDEAATPAQQQISRRQNEMDKVVVSDTLTEDETDPWRDTTSIVRRADAHARIAELKSAPGEEIVVAGSHILWNDLLVHGLVDEFHLMIGAAVVASGTPAFDISIDRAGLPAREPNLSLRLIDVTKPDDTENILARYEVRPTN
jgi:dihydrofolate reductase